MNATYPRYGILTNAQELALNIIIVAEHIARYINAEVCNY